MVRQLKAIGGAVIGFGVNVFRGLQLVWYLGVVLFAVLLVIDLFRIPVSVNDSWKYAPEQTLWAKMTPEEEAQLLERQKDCHHIYTRHGYPTYYCALCRKRLTKDKAPLWQL